jgi:DNA-directed RNA polymerase specialized sigma subunit
MVDSVIQTDHRLAKQIKLYFCHKYSRLKLKEIGKYFGIGESGVSQTSLPETDKPQAF